MALLASEVEDNNRSPIYGVKNEEEQIVVKFSHRERYYGWSGNQSRSFVSSFEMIVISKIVRRFKIYVWPYCQQKDF